MGKPLARMPLLLERLTTVRVGGGEKVVGATNVAHSGRAKASITRSKTTVAVFF